MKLLRQIKLAWQARRLLAAVEREEKMGFKLKAGISKALWQAAFNLVSIVGTAALVALLDPAFWAKATEGNVPPAVVLAAAPVLHALQELLRGFFKHAR